MRLYYLAQALLIGAAAFLALAATVTRHPEWYCGSVAYALSGWCLSRMENAR